MHAKLVCTYFYNHILFETMAHDVTNEAKTLIPPLPVNFFAYIL